MVSRFFTSQKLGFLYAGNIYIDRKRKKRDRQKRETEKETETERETGRQRKSYTKYLRYLEVEVVLYKVLKSKGFAP